MRELRSKQVPVAMKNIANYYRSSRLYTNLSNCTDAYDWYIQQYTSDTNVIVEQGFSYYNKNEYLIAVRIDVLRETHPDVFEHYFSCVWNDLSRILDRETDDVIFICAIGPSHDHFTSDTYKLVNQFVEEYRDEYCIITDCPVQIDFPRFAEYTGSVLVPVAGCEYFRWSRRK